MTSRFLVATAVTLSAALGAPRAAHAGDPAKKLMFIPNGGEGNVTVVHQDSPDKYTVMETVATVPGAKTIAVDSKTHNVYVFQPERGPVPPPAPGAPTPTPAPPGVRVRGPLGPIVAAWFVAIRP